jgi:hypothetical protein
MALFHRLKEIAVVASPARVSKQQPRLCSDRLTLMDLRYVNACCGVTSGPHPIRRNDDD